MKMTLNLYHSLDHTMKLKKKKKRGTVLQYVTYSIILGTLTYASKFTLNSGILCCLINRLDNSLKIMCVLSHVI